MSRSGPTRDLCKKAVEILLRYAVALCGKMKITPQDEERAYAAYFKKTQAYDIVLGDILPKDFIAKARAWHEKMFPPQKPQPPRGHASNLPLDCGDEYIAKALVRDVGLDRARVVHEAADQDPDEPAHKQGLAISAGSQDLYVGMGRP